MTRDSALLVPVAALAGLLVGGVSLFLLTTSHPLYALLPAPLLAVAFVLGRFPTFAYYLFVVLMPFELIMKLSTTQKELTFAKILGIQMLVTAALLLFFNRSLTPRLRSNLWPIFALFVLVNVFSSLLSPDILGSFDDLRRLLSALIIFALTLFFVNDRGYSRIIPTLLIWGVLFNYLLFHLEFFFNVTFPWGRMFPAHDADQRVYSFPSGYSIYLVFLIPLLMHRVTFGKSVREKVVSSILLFATLAGIVTLGSRAALLCVLFVILAAIRYYMPLMKPKLLGFILAAVALSLALGLLLIPQHYWDRQKTVVETKTDSSILMRISYLQSGWEFFLEHPLFGSGPGSFKDLYAVSPYAQQFVSAKAGYVRSAHNTFLEVLVGTGLVGLLIFLVAIGLCVRNFTRAASLQWSRGNQAEALMDRAYLTTFLVTIFYFFFISYLYMKTFWIFFALSQLALNRARNESPPPSREA